jgi:hypothetical protein
VPQGKVNHLREKIKGQCPCGYFFTSFVEIEEAISIMKLHFELFHKDCMPFGITDDEALALLKKEKFNSKEYDETTQYPRVKAKTVQTIELNNAK